MPGVIDILVDGIRLFRFLLLADVVLNTGETIIGWPAAGRMGIDQLCCIENWPIGRLVGRWQSIETTSNVVPSASYPSLPEQRAPVATPGADGEVAEYSLEER